MTDMSAQLERLTDNSMTDVRAWNAPLINGRALSPARMNSAEDLQGPERQAWVDAEAAGRAAGLAAAQRQIDARMRQLDEATGALSAALQALARPLAHVDEEVHGQVVELAIAIARGLLRRELRADPAQIIGIVRETVALLPAAARGVRVLLHPEDAALLREKLPAGGPDQAWSIIDDPALSRGDCRVHTEYAQVDARVETRLKATLAALLGDERAQARGAESE
jgi:flagellar assembly protein FliH